MASPQFFEGGLFFNKEMFFNKYMSKTQLANAPA